MNDSSPNTRYAKTSLDRKLPTNCPIILISVTVHCSNQQFCHNETQNSIDKTLYHPAYGADISCRIFRIWWASSCSPPCVSIRVSATAVFCKSGLLRLDTLCYRLFQHLSYTFTYMTCGIQKWDRLFEKNFRFIPC